VSFSPPLLDGDVLSVKKSNLRSNIGEAPKQYAQTDPPLGRRAAEQRDELATSQMGHELGASG
jgi:hypothetical protein